MDYKKIIKNRSFRLKALALFDFIPDKQMVKLQYFIKTGRRLNLKNPKRFTEKLQRYKLFYRDPRMKQCVDKYEVREYVRQCGYSNILNELYGVYNAPEEIDFSKLPDSFVLKDTLGGGGNAVIVVKDKTAFDTESIRVQLQEWVNIPIMRKHPGREWVYEERPHRIVVEKYIEADMANGGLIDYKFFCFGGKCEFLYVVIDRALGGKAQFGIFDCNFNKLDVCREDELELSEMPKKPENFDDMVIIAQALAKEFPEIRVDLYNVDGKIFFGEMTFFDGSGYMTFRPDEFDIEAGSSWDIEI